MHHVSQGNGPVRLQVGVRITSKPTNVVLYNSASDNHVAKNYKVLPVERLQLNSQYDTDQNRFLFVWRDFTVRYKYPKKVRRRITHRIKA